MPVSGGNALLVHAVVVLEEVSRVAAANRPFDETFEAHRVLRHSQDRHHRRAQQRHGDAPESAKPDWLLEDDVSQPGQAHAEQHDAPANRQGRRLAITDSRKRQQRPVPEIQRVADQAEPHRSRLRQPLPIEPGMRPARDDQERSGGRQQRPAPGIVRALVNEGHGHRNQCEADSAGGVGQPTPAGFITRCVAPPRLRHGGFVGQASQNRTREQLPESRERREKSAHEVGPDADQVKAQ